MACCKPVSKAAWARLIRKVYEADPLQCPKCKGPMRVIALIEGPAVVRAILVPLGRWQPKAVERVCACLKEVNAGSIRPRADRARPERLESTP